MPVRRTRPQEECSCQCLYDRSFFCARPGTTLTLFFHTMYKCVRMRSVIFNALHGLPSCPIGLRLLKITFSTCPGQSLEVRVVKDVDGEVDSQYGVPRDSWWSIDTPNLPTRVVRLFWGAHSLQEFIKRYGFLDASGCIHHRDATAWFTNAQVELEPFDLEQCVPKHLMNATGVPQFMPNSGVCWYAALCCVFFGPKDVRDWVTSFMPPRMKHLCEQSLFDREAALALRRMWWYDYQIGDDVDLPPEMDGRNGFSEWSVLCAKLQIPLLRYSFESGHLRPMNMHLRDRKGKSVTAKLPNCSNKHFQKHFLALRYIDGDHHERHPILRRVVMNNIRYIFVGCASGNRKCGHQIGWCATDSWRRVMAGDADLHKDGIGPLFICFGGKRWREEWWKGCREMLHVAKFGAGRREFCNLSPHNEKDKLLDAYRGEMKTTDEKKGEPGKNCLDLIYISDKLHISGKRDPGENAWI